MCSCLGLLGEILLVDLLFHLPPIENSIRDSCLIQPSE